MVFTDQMITKQYQLVVFQPPIFVEHYAEEYWQTIMQDRLTLHFSLLRYRNIEALNPTVF